MQTVSHILDAFDDIAHNNIKSIIVCHMHLGACIHKREPTHEPAHCVASHATLIVSYLCFADTTLLLVVSLLLTPHSAIKCDMVERRELLRARLGVGCFFISSASFSWTDVIFCFFYLYVSIHLVIVS